jgi:Na+-transporting NADH:ubiquinone oxidoreductase subunit A
MSKTIKIKKGFDINLAGKAQKKIGEIDMPETFAFKPTDFKGILRPKLMVSEGDSVKSGTPLLFCKMQEEIKYCAPVSGEVIEVKRGAKRKLLEIKILADKEIEYENFQNHVISDLIKLDRVEVQKQMMISGVWPNIIQRPYGIVANPEDTPKAIFISTFDSHPLAPDYDFIFSGQEHHFQAGIEILKKFTNGRIHLGLDAKAEVSKIFSHIKDVQINKFAGPHPAGNVGTQIHKVDPINKGDILWTVNPYGVIQIGKLFLEGRYDASKIIAVAGSELKTPQYYKTYTGANVSKYLEGNLTEDHVRVISGNVLTGENIGKNGFVGFYDHLVSVIPEGDKFELFGWILPTVNKLSFHRAFGLLSFLAPKKEFSIGTNLYGEKRAFVQTGIFEQVTPLDILPTFLLKAIMAEDYDEMEALGIYEVIEEDLALCEFVDVSKHEIQSILREGLNLIKNS